MRNNPFRHSAPPGWNNIADAPRDGTPIELQNNWGVAPHYGVCKWAEDRQSWAYVGDEDRAMSDGGHLSWRPFVEEAASYVDPTLGAQHTEEYWREASHRLFETTLRPAAAASTPPTGIWAEMPVIVKVALGAAALFQAAALFIAFSA